VFDLCFAQGRAVGEAPQQREHKPDTNATTLVNVDALNAMRLTTSSAVNNHCHRSPP